MQTNLPLTRDLVLIGGGHTHALVLRKWAMRPLPGARVTLIDPAPAAAYSGMLPGFVAGHYTRDALDIDLVRLARLAGARVILDKACGLDTDKAEVHLEGRAPVGFDIASLDVGITSQMPDLRGFAAHGVPAKPLGPFASRWADFRDADGPASVAVLGAGVAGAELAMAMAFALRQRGRPSRVTLIDRSQALSALRARARERILRALEGLGVTLIELAEVARITAGTVHLKGKEPIKAGFICGAAGARPHPWLAETGLALVRGAIAVSETLQSSDPRLFACGDCAEMTHAPRPKAGVFAVRQAPVLFDNLRAALSGGPLRGYHPQKDYLKLVSLGGKSALAEKAGVPLSGPLMWRWKDRIDQAFMRQFREMQPMAAAPLPVPRALGGAEVAKPLCTGCGSKVARGALQSAVRDLPRFRTDVTPLPGDDAALLRIGEARQVLTTDHLSAVTEDPGLLAHLAAVHALGDIWAMGAAPQVALAQITLPRMSAALQARSLTEVMAAAGAVFQAAGAQIVGGHSTMGPQMSIGFSVTGLCPGEPISLSGAQPGDALILTKPIGTGVLLAAEMAGRVQGRHIAHLFRSMSRPLAQDAAILAPHARAMTDVTGFGLAGHIDGLCNASGCGADLVLSAIPVLPAALDLSAAGVASSLYDSNRALVPAIADQGAARLLFDPQTCGGLLAAVPRAEAEGLVSRLREAGAAEAAVIGHITAELGQISLR